MRPLDVTTAKLAIAATVTEAFRRGKLRPEGLDRLRDGFDARAEIHPDQTVEQVAEWIENGGASFRPADAPAYFVITQETKIVPKYRLHTQAGQVEPIPQWAALPDAAALVPTKGLPS